jgi:hypothetical protein
VQNGGHDGLPSGADQRVNYREIGIFGLLEMIDPDLAEFDQDDL